ncbi:MAG: phosphoenolpyruvate--protein phosphotransferase, partial [Kiritimatiellae bacterium]|nr:phosphoenolpyruvate--protein phosphotransferase [Kiritimatiellia bacterium]
VAPEAVEDELARFQAARAAARDQVAALIGRLREDGASGGEADVFANHLELFDDVLLVTAVERNIREGRVNAETAVRRAMGEFRDVFARMKDAYLRERARDLDDIERRIMRVLTSTEETAISQIDRPSIIVADDLTPSETVALRRDFVLGFATDRGSTTSHVALLARALGIPAVAGLGDVTARAHSGGTILLDGTNGTVTLDPDEGARAEFDKMMRRSREFYFQLSDSSSRSGTLKDGTPVSFRANVQPGVPLCGLATYGAEGIGLYRSEYLWLGEDGNPSEEKQAKTYAEAARAVAGMGAGARVVFRALDLGGDKLLNGTLNREANPFLGCRSIRWLLAHRDVFRTQLRAILRASAAGPSSVMYPMIATRDELRAANEELDRAKAELAAEGVPFDASIPHGCMIEVPAAALAAEQLAREADFFSIGTNDLVQYTMAADRGNEQVAYLYQPAHPAVIRLVDMTAAAAKARGIPAAVCGESASDPVLAALWIGLGVTSLSMGASGIPVVRRVLRGLSSADVAELAEKVRALCADRSAADIYAFCRAFLQEKIPDFESFQP